MADQWEYHILTAQSLDDLDELDGNLARLGEEGWELTGIIPPASSPTARSANRQYGGVVRFPPSLVAADLQAPQAIDSPLRS